MAAAQTIKIKCKGAATLDPAKLLEFQGELKSLTNDDYLRLRKQIVEAGFSEPISVWKSGNKNYILNGHQRLRTVQKMIEEGWECPPLPISIIEAKNRVEAKKKLLAFTSQYGKVESQGLYEFVMDAQIAPDDLYTNFRLPEIDLPSFTEEFFIDKTPVSDPLGTAAIEAAAGNDDEDSATTGPVADGSHAYIKMVQLLFDEEKHRRFQAMVEELKQTLAIDNVTDVCLKAVEELHATHCKSAGGPRTKRRPAAGRENGVEQ
jgi:hypothetical protein